MADEQPEIVVKPKRPWWKKLIRISIWIFSAFIFLIILLSGLLWIYQDEVKGYVIAEVNQRVNTTIIVDPAKIDVTIISSFPNVGVDFNDISALDATNAKKRDTLFTAHNISLAFNIMDLFDGKYEINTITIRNAKINMWVDEKGKDNFHFLKDTPADISNDTSHVSFAIKKFELNNVAFVYRNKKDKFLADVLFRETEFSGNFGSTLYDMESTADMQIRKLSYRKTNYFTNKPAKADISIEINNDKASYALKNVKLSVADLDMNVLGSVAERGKNYLLDLSVTGENIDISSALSLLPASYAEDVDEYESSGEFYMNGTIKGLAGDTVSPDIKTQFGIRSGGKISRKNSGVTLENVVCTGTYSNVKGEEGLKIPSFSATSARSKFKGSFSMIGFDHPEYNAQIDGILDLGELQGILQIDTIEQMSGEADVSFNAHGKPAKAKPTAADFRNFETTGKINMKGISLHLKGRAEPFDSISGGLSFDGNNVDIAALKVRTPSSDLHVDGSVKNLLGFIFTENEVLNISGEMSSANLDLNKLLADKDSASSKSNSAYHLDLPQRIRCDLKTSVGHVKFRQFEANSIATDLVLSNKRLVADPISFRSMDGVVDGSGMIDGTMKDSLLITCNANMRDVNIMKMFLQFENFGQEKDTVITYNNIRGKLSSKINFASLWGKDLNVNEHKIYTDADITITQGEMINFLPFNELSHFISLDDLRDVKFQKLHNTITINDRIITIPQMDISSSAINLAMSGTHDFDNMVDYHFVVDMDELHAKKVKAKNKKASEFGEEIDDGGHRFKVYINMKGYIGNPDISYDKKGAWQGIKDDAHQQGIDLRKVLHDEFGVFRNDSLNPKDKNRKDDRKKPDDKFILAPETSSGTKGDAELNDEDDY